MQNFVGKTKCIVGYMKAANYRYQIWTFCNWIPRDSQVNYEHLNGWIPSQCFLQFWKLMKSATDVFHKRRFSKGFFNFDICYRYGLRVAQFRDESCSIVISNRPRASRSSNFQIIRAISLWIVTPLGPFTITNIPPKCTKKGAIKFLLCSNSTWIGSYQVWSVISTNVRSVNADSDWLKTNLGMVISLITKITISSIVIGISH